ncbi:MAG: leucyl/phenylalanyl-tRNA--protein transferase [Armatimonadetes bacterium]|nr:leucyl/phenylalanyl-tRNA--protein transferase [Armatimonadota bacterium]
MYQLTPGVIHYGYSIGCFPMTMSDGSLEWFQPHRRCLFPITGIHVPASLARTIRKNEFEITFDKAFEEVMRGCKRPEGSWISDHFIEVYTEIHRQGWGHSCECWKDGELVGGIYGIAIGSYFAAESMYHTATNASKVALWAMVQKAAAMGMLLFDAQIMNPHLERLGAYEVPNYEFSLMLKKTIKIESPWGLSPSAANLLQTS